jgi:hypothetical protein
MLDDPLDLVIVRRHVGTLEGDAELTVTFIQCIVVDSSLGAIDAGWEGKSSCWLQGPHAVFLSSGCDWTEERCDGGGRRDPSVGGVGWFFFVSLPHSTRRFMGDLDKQMRRGVGPGVSCRWALTLGFCHHKVRVIAGMVEGKKS